MKNELQFVKVFLAGIFLRFLRLNVFITYPIKSSTFSLESAFSKYQINPQKSRKSNFLKNNSKTFFYQIWNFNWKVENYNHNGKVFCICLSAQHFSFTVKKIENCYFSDKKKSWGMKKLIRIFWYANS